jgi:hypothetical protein
MDRTPHRGSVERCGVGHTNDSNNRVPQTRFEFTNPAGAALRLIALLCGDWGDGMIRLRGSVRVIYEHGEPHCVRDDSGVICLFNPVTKFPGQDERYRREMRERAAIADFVCRALAEADRLEELPST